MSDQSDEETGLIAPIIATATAKFDFTARKETELSFKKGDVIKITLMAGNWWQGILANSKEDEPQKFPCNYVIIDPDTMVKEDAVVTKEFKERNSNEITVPANAKVIAIDHKAGSTWTTVEYKGRRGLIPTSFLVIEEIPPPPVAPMPDIPPPPIVPPTVTDTTKSARPMPGLTITPPRIEKHQETVVVKPPSNSSELLRPPPLAGASLEAPLPQTKNELLAPPARIRSQSTSIKRGGPPPFMVQSLRSGGSSNSGSTSPDPAGPPRMRVPQLKVGAVSPPPMVNDGSAVKAPTTSRVTRQREGSDHATFHAHRRSNRYSMDPRLMEKPPELKLGLELPSSTSPKITIPESSKTMVVQRNKRLSAGKGQLEAMAEAAGFIPLAEKGQFESFPFDEPDSPETIITKRGTITIPAEGAHPERVEDGDVLVAATLPKIIAYITAPNERFSISVEAREQMIKVFAACFKLHKTPAEMFIMLESRFCSARSNVVDVRTATIAAEVELNVLKIIREWVKCAFEFDFKNDALLSTTLKTFLNSIVGDTVPKGDPRFIIHYVRRTAEQLLESFNLYESRSDSWANHAMGVISAEGEFNPFLKSIAEKDCDVVKGGVILDLDPREYAEQLTLMEFYLFEKITPSELLSGAWTKKDAEERSPHIVAMTRFFNQKSRWAEQAILSCEDNETRRHMLKHFLHIAECLFEIGDYNGMMIYLSAVQSSSITRLKKIWKSKETKLAEKLGKLMASNFKELRQLQSTVTPCVPYLGMTLTDLVYIADGNPDYYKNEKGEETQLFNWEKMLLMGQAFQRLAHLQRTSYSFEPQSDIIRLIHSMRPTITEDDAYQMSLKIQPRGSHKDKDKS